MKIHVEKKKFNRHVAKKCILQSTLSYHLVARIDNNREIETLGRDENEKE